MRQTCRRAWHGIALGIVTFSALAAVNADGVAARSAHGVPPPGLIYFGRGYVAATEQFRHPQNVLRVGRTFGWLAHLRRTVQANQLMVRIDVRQAGAPLKRLGPVEAAPNNTALVSVIHSSLPGREAVREGLNLPGTYTLHYFVGSADLASGTFRLTR